MTARIPVTKSNPRLLLGADVGMMSLDSPCLTRCRTLKAIRERKREREKERERERERGRKGDKEIERERADKGPTFSGGRIHVFRIESDIGK